MQAWEQAGIWDELHKMLLTKLRQANELHEERAIVDSTQVRAFGGGDKTSPSPVDRLKKWTKYTLMVDRDGVPLVIRAAAANRSDQLDILLAVVSYPSVPAKWDVHRRIQRNYMRTPATTAKPHEPFSVGWASSRTFANATSNTAAV